MKGERGVAGVAQHRGDFFRFAARQAVNDAAGPSARRDEVGDLAFPVVFERNRER